MNEWEILAQPKVKRFVVNHLNSDVKKLVLNPPAEFKESIKPIALQIQARQKAKKKLSSWVANQDLLFPAPISVEQASSETTANYKKNLLKGSSLVDLTGGMGVDCLSLSDNFEKTTYVDQNADLCGIFKHNCKILGKNIEVANSEASMYVEELLSSDTSIFLDPARRDNSQNKVFKLDDCSPNLKELLPSLKSKASKILIKLSPLLDIKSVLNEFTNVGEIHVVSVKNECKELLVLIDPNLDGEPNIIAVNLETDEDPYSFKYSEESEAPLTIGEPKSHLFEPNSSIMKAGAFKKIAVDFSLKKLETNTHLYTLENTTKALPGRTFKILEDQVDTKVIEKYAEGKSINVVTRNYPMRAEALKKKFNVKDGGSYFLIGYTNMAGKAKLIIAEKV